MPSIEDPSPSPELHLEVSSVITQVYSNLPDF